MISIEFLLNWWHFHFWVDPLWNVKTTKYTFFFQDDNDDDGDGILDGDEDDDGDGIENDEDSDDDGDGVLDENDELWKIVCLNLSLVFSSSGLLVRCCFVPCLII